MKRAQIILGGESVEHRIRKFLRCRHLDMPIVTRSFSSFDLPNLQLAIGSVAKQSGGGHEVIGFVKALASFSNSFRELIMADRVSSTHVGPVQFRQIDVGGGQTVACMEEGIHLVDMSEGRVAALVRRNELKGNLELEVIGESQLQADLFILRVRDALDKNNVYRGKVISIEGEPGQVGQRCRNATIRFHEIPSVMRKQIILPEQILNVLERNTIGFFESLEALSGSGQSAKRGLLLFGKPGTGKTFTARWLAQAVPGMTVLLMSGEQLWLVRECCQIARMLAPTLVIMEDVDLIASVRDEPASGPSGDASSTVERNGRRGLGRADSVSANDEPSRRDRTGARLETRKSRPSD